MLGEGARSLKHPLGRADLGMDLEPTLSKLVRTSWPSFYLLVMLAGQGLGFAKRAPTIHSPSHPPAHPT